MEEKGLKKKIVPLREKGYIASGMTERLIRDREAAILNPESFKQKMERFLFDREAALNREREVGRLLGTQPARIFSCIFIERYNMIKYIRMWEWINSLEDATKYNEQVLFLEQSEVLYYLTMPNRILPAGQPGGS